jgi:hypothetical protein
VEVDQAFGGLFYQPSKIQVFREARITEVNESLEVAYINWLTADIESGASGPGVHAPEFPKDPSTGEAFDKVGLHALRAQRQPNPSCAFAVSDEVEVKVQNSWWRSKVARIDTENDIYYFTGKEYFTGKALNSIHPFGGSHVAVDLKYVRDKSAITASLCGTLGCGRKKGHKLACTPA